jgi:hypothetical protein
MLKKVSPLKKVPSPVVVNKGKHGYTCWVYVSTIENNGSTYHKYKSAHTFKQKFVFREDAMLYGWAKINGHDVTTHDVPMRHKPVPI